METLGISRTAAFPADQPKRMGEVEDAPLEDAHLMERAAAGDRRAFGRLVDRHKDGLVNFLTRLAGCRDRAEDLAQETFLRLYQRAGRYEDRGHFLPYLYRIATNLLRSQQRRDSRWRLLRWSLEAGADPAVSVGFLPASAPPPPAALLSAELERQVARAIAALPLTLRAPLVLHEVEGWPYHEIARTLDCREGTVKSRIFRARQRLKKLLAPYWQAPYRKGAAETPTGAEP